MKPTRRTILQAGRFGGLGSLLPSASAEIPAASAKRVPNGHINVTATARVPKTSTAWCVTTACTASCSSC